MGRNPSGLRPQSAKAKRERDSLLRQLLLFEALVQIRRLNVIERLFGRYAGPKAVDEIANILKRYRLSSASAPKRLGGSTRRQGEAVWLTELCNPRPRLIQSRRSRLVGSLFTPLHLVQGRDARARERRILRMVREGRALLGKGEMRGHRAEILLWDLSNNAEGLLRSREWRAGKTIGGAVERLFRSPSDAILEQKILATLDSYRAWMHRRPRVLFRRDRERAIERYHRYVENVEAKLSEQAKAAGSTASVRVIVLPSDGSPLESVSNEQHLESVSAVWPAADWHERETHDLLGVSFRGHPDLRRLLLPEDWIGHPLRRDYSEQKSYQGIPTSRPGTNWFKGEGFRYSNTVVRPPARSTRTRSSRTRRTSAADPGRSSGCLLSIPKMSVSSTGGISVLCVLGGTTGAYRCWEITASGSSAVKGRRPAVISYSITPRA